MSQIASFYLLKDGQRRLYRDQRIEDRLYYMAVPSLRHNCANAMALLCHSIGTTDESLILAPTGSIRKGYPALSLVSDMSSLSIVIAGICTMVGASVFANFI